MKKSHLYDFLYNIAGSILYAAGIDTFAGQQDLHRAVYQDLPDPESSVGTAGGIMTLVLNVPLVLISYKVVGKNSF